MTIITDVSHDYAEMTITEKIAMGYHVVELMGINVAIFVTPDDPLINLTTATDNLKKANQAYLANPKMHDALKASERAWVKVMNKQAKYVSRIADHVAGTIDLSGFNHTKTESNPLAKPSTPVINDSYPEGKGKYYVHVKPQAGCSFVFIICGLDAVITQTGSQLNVVSASKAPFAFITDTHPTAEFTNVTSGDQHLVVASFNRTGMCTLTPPSTISVP